MARRTSCYNAGMTAGNTAEYTKMPAGYMGQLIEWPEVVTEGKTIEECRALLRDALNEMMLAYRQQGAAFPHQPLS